MGWLKNLFGDSSELTQEERNEYTAGFRCGWPCETDAPITPNWESPQFRRGYAEGRKTYKRLPPESLDEQGRMKS